MSARSTSPIPACGRQFAGARFTCAQKRRFYDASPPRVCGCLGHVIVRPRPDEFIPPSKSIPWCSISCPRCVPSWEISQAAKHLSPWRELFGAPGARSRLPGLPIASYDILERARRHPSY